MGEETSTWPAGSAIEFRSSLAGNAPPEGLDTALQAIWWAGKGDWNRAHECAQTGEGDRDCDFVHAHLHRQEGDAGNAGYWYRRVGEPAPDLSVAEEWDQLTDRLLARPNRPGTTS